MGNHRDFSGDEMNGMLIKNPESIAETRLTSSIHQWFVSYKDSQPLYGLFQDSIIGSYEMTLTKTDKISRSQLQKALQTSAKTLNTKEILPFSAVTSLGKEQLLEKIHTAIDSDSRF